MKQLTKPLALAGGLLLATVLVARYRPATPLKDAVSIRFQGYTNVPATERSFGVFTVSNRAKYPIRWRSDGIQIVGNSQEPGRTVSAGFVGKSYQPVLKGGDSIVLTVSEPFSSDEAGRWRLAMTYSRYGWRERWHDSSMNGKAPNHKIFGDQKEIVNPANHNLVTGDWLEKAPLK